MKILLLSPSLNSGGVETGTIDLAKSIKNKGEDIIVVSSGGALVKELEESNIRHITLPIHKKSLTVFSQVAKLSNIIKQEHIDIVHAQSRIPAWVAYFACKNTCTPFITSCHGYYSKHLFSSVMGKGCKVIVISQIIGKHMQDNFRVPEEKIRLVYRGVDLYRYHFQKDKYSLAKDKFVVANISRITPIKGQREFIKAIDIVAKKIPNIEVWIVGSADKKKKHYELNLYQLVKELNLEDKVKFLGRRTDIPQILKDADLLVLSTQVPEAFGRVIIEAGASGVPVCASQTGGIVEIIEHKKDGLLFDFRNTDSMAEAIVTMAKDPELRERCRNNLRAKVEGRFSLEQMSEKTLNVYREVAGKKKILVIKLGGLGDLILSIPSLKMLRGRFPKASISLLINSSFGPLVAKCPYVDEIILFDRKKKGLFSLTDDLRKRKFDCSVDLKNNRLTHLIAYLSHIPSRHGFARGFTRLLLSYAEPSSRDLVEQPVRQQFRLLQNMGVSDFDDKLELWPSSQGKDFINNILMQKGILKTDKLVGLAIGASPKWPTKDWPIDKFCELSKMLIKEGIKVILLGTDHSRDKVGKFPNDKGIFSLVAETDSDQLISLIERLDILVSGDSAPMHIASAVGVKTIALFGPTDPIKHAPPGEKVSALVKRIECQPCYKRSCNNKEKLECLNKISVQEVFNLITQNI